jgi:hypothetical protein
MTVNWRRDYPILVPEAHAIAMIGVIRSLGAAGYPVHVVATAADALGLRSRYAQSSSVCPPYAHPEFVDWLRGEIKAKQIRGIAPVGIFQPIRPFFDEFKPLLPLSADLGVVYNTFSKFHVFSTLLGAADPAVRANIPPTILLSRGDPLPGAAELQRFTPPFFLKTDTLHTEGGAQGKVERVDAAAGVAEAAAALLAQAQHVVVQGFVPGKGAAAAFVLIDDEIQAEFMNLCLHEVPHTGGYCSLRQSWQHAAMLADARAKLRHLRWQGIAMLEYRWDPATDRFYFIEVNARFWAALHVALYAGADLPRILFDRFFGKARYAPEPYRLGVRCRFTFPFEIGHVLSRCRDPVVPLASRLWSVLEFFLLGLDWRVHGDLLYPGDRGLYLTQMVRAMRDLPRRPGGAG